MMLCGAAKWDSYNTRLNNASGPEEQTVLPKAVGPIQASFAPDSLLKTHTDVSIHPQSLVASYRTYG